MTTYSFGQKTDGSLGVTSKNGLDTSDAVYGFDKGEIAAKGDLIKPEVEAPALDVPSPDLPQLN